jgi:hypothetical protein
MSVMGKQYKERSNKDGSSAREIRKHHQKLEHGLRGYDAHSGTLQVICTVVVFSRLICTETEGVEWD